MVKINPKFLENVSDIELLKFYSDELLNITEYPQYNLSQEDINKHIKATVSNFTEQLIECIENSRKVKL
ncbi:MAG: hypothetical protein PHE78_03560 [Candidatus Gastranaerophilales bacterium]|jgi:hypothetical protein|nr:hypothetical protein [Candidatus Gastranaerophilales bacterium]